MAQDTRKDPRAKVLTLTVRYKSATVDEFIEHHSHDVSRGGMFIKTPSPFPPGTLLKFEIKISDERAVVQGVGRVVWKRETTQTSADLPAGMGVKFIKLDESSRSLIDRLVASKPEGTASAYESDPAARERPSGPAQPPAPSPSLASARKGTIIGLGSPMKGDFSSLVPTNEPGFFPAQDGPPQQPPPEERTVMKQATELLQEALKDTSGSVVTEAPLFESSPPPSHPSTPGRPAAPSATPAPGPGYAPSPAHAFAPTPTGPSFNPSHAAPAQHSPSFAPTPTAPTHAPFGGAPAHYGAPAAAPPFAAQPHAPAFGAAPSASTPFALTPAPPPAFAGSPGAMPSPGFGGQPSYGNPGGPPHGFNPGGPPVGAQPADPYGSRARSLPPAAPTPSSGSSGRIFIFAGLVAVAGVGVWFASRSLLGGSTDTTPPAVTASAEPSASEPTPAESAPPANPSAPASALAPDAPASAPPAMPSAPPLAASGETPAPATSASIGAPAASVPTGAAGGAPSSSAGGTAGAAVAPVVKTPTVPRPRRPPTTTTATPTSTTTATEEKKPPSSEGGGSDDKKPAPIDHSDNPY